MARQKSGTKDVIPKILLAGVLSDADAQQFADTASKWIPKATLLYEELKGLKREGFDDRVEMVKFIVMICAQGAAKRAGPDTFFSDTAVEWAQKGEQLYEEMYALREDTFRQRVELLKFMVTICVQAAVHQKMMGRETVAPPRPTPEEALMDTVSTAHLERVAEGLA